MVNALLINYYVIIAVTLLIDDSFIKTFLVMESVLRLFTIPRLCAPRRVGEVIKSLTLLIVREYFLL